MRLNGWEERLTAELDGIHTRPFSWAENDCCTFASRCVQAVTGRDLRRAFYYHDRRGALCLLRLNGGIEAICDRFFVQVPLGFAKRGDLILIRRTAVGVCAGEFAVAPGPARIPRGEWLAAWSV